MPHHRPQPPPFLVDGDEIEGSGREGERYTLYGMLYRKTQKGEEAGERSVLIKEAIKAHRGRYFRALNVPGVRYSGAL